MDRETINDMLNDFKNWYCINDTTFAYELDIFLKIEIKYNNFEKDNKHIKPGTLRPNNGNKDIKIKKSSDIKLYVKYKNNLIDEIDAIHINYKIDEEKIIIIPAINIIPPRTKNSISKSTIPLALIINKYCYENKPTDKDELNKFSEEQKKEMFEKIEMIIIATPVTDDN